MTPSQDESLPDESLPKPLRIGDHTFDIRCVWPCTAEQLAEQLNSTFIAHAEFEVRLLSGQARQIDVRLVSDAASRAYRRVQRWFDEAHPVTGLYARIGRVTVSQCPDCTASVRREALDFHRGSAMCLEAQRVHDLRARGYVNAGQAYRTIESAGIDVQWIPYQVAVGTDRDDMPCFWRVDGIRVAPAWAVRIARCTVVPHDLRTVVLQHCAEHEGARDALLAALRLGVGRTKASRQNTPSKAPPQDAERIKQLFSRCLLYVGSGGLT